MCCASGRQQQAVDQLQRGRLPRTAAAQQHQRFSSLHREHEVLQQRASVQEEGSAIKFYGWYFAGSPVVGGFAVSRLFVSRLAPD